MISFALAGLLLAAQPLNCDEARTQADLNQCAALEADQADADLNRIYPQVVAAYAEMDRDGETKEGVARLRAAQRAWIAFREAECALAGYQALGGSLEPLLVSGCEADLTRRRTAELRRMLANR